MSRMPRSVFSHLEGYYWFLYIITPLCRASEPADMSNWFLFCKISSITRD